jgi:ammonia channel protein AmtB
MHAISWPTGFGFNPGTALLLTDNPYQSEIGALCACNTFLASAGGCVAAMLSKLYQGYRETGDWSFDLIVSMNGSLGGLVAIVSRGTVETCMVMSNI